MSEAHTANDNSHQAVTLAKLLNTELKIDPTFQAFLVDRDSLSELPLDTELYRSHRDICKSFNDVPNKLIWRMDAIHLNGGILPSGEPTRTIGHWNQLDQFEYFHVRQGSVYMVCASPESRYIIFRCEPGSCVTLPPGWWHTTYAATDEAAYIENIYCSSTHPLGEQKAAKYFSQAPLRVALRLNTLDPGTDTNDDAIVSQEPAQPLGSQSVIDAPQMINVAPMVDTLRDALASTEVAAQARVLLKSQAAELAAE